MIMFPPLRLFLLLLIMTLALAEVMPFNRGKAKCSKRNDCKDEGGKCQDKDESCLGKKLEKKCGPKKCVCCVEYCLWHMDTKEFPAAPPLILDSNGDTILPRDEARIVKVKRKSILTIGCPGDNNKFENSKLNGAKSIKVQCKSKKALVLRNDDGTNSKKVFKMTELGCEDNIKASIKNDNSPCQNYIQGRQYSIGFAYSDAVNDFLTMIQVCFNPNHETTYWTKHTIHGKHLSARYDTSNIGRYFYVDRDRFSNNITYLYSALNQREVMENAIGDENIIKEKKRYLARGHLSPVADFITKAEMLATNQYINALPQWNDINNGNWKKVEKETRKLAEDQIGSINVEVFSGGFGIQEINGNDIFLEDIDDEVPVPEYFWKIVKVGNKAVAFVVNNNPFLDQVPNPPLCTDVCDDLNWLKNFDVWDRTELCHGYTLCCRVDNQLYNNINTIPNIGTFALLDN